MIGRFLAPSVSVEWATSRFAWIWPCLRKPDITYAVQHRFNMQTRGRTIQLTSSTRTFVLQAQTAATVIGPSTTVAGASCFSLTIIVTYPASAVQLPFSDPAAAALGSVAFAVSGPHTFAVNSSGMTVRLPSSFKGSHANSLGVPYFPVRKAIMLMCCHNSKTMRLKHLRLQLAREWSYADAMTLSMEQAMTAVAAR